MNKINKVNDIKSLRKIINDLDQEIIKKIAQRLEVAEKIGILKKREKKAILDKGREAELKNLHNKWSKKLALNNKVVKQMFDLLMQESKKIQK